jgi:hypothetical protein
MKNKVKVTANEQNEVVVPSTTNKEWGYVRVIQDRLIIDENGFASVKTMSALIPGRLEDLKRMGFTKGQEIDGKIIFKEQLVPFNKKEPERDVKVAGKTGIVCKIGGNPIYRKCFYVTNSSAEDVFILDNAGNVLSHDNVDEIREAYNKVSSDVTSEADLNNA